MPSARPVQPSPEYNETSSSGPLRPTSLLISQGSCPNGTQSTCCLVHPCRQRYGSEELSMIDCPNRQVGERTEMFCAPGSRGYGEINSACPGNSHVLPMDGSPISVGVSTPDHSEPTRSIEVGARARRPEDPLLLPSCSICRLTHCVPLTSDETLEYDKLMKDLQVYAAGYQRAFSM
jgi:hypothetical protein